jgi:hypothetical protein
MHRAASAAEAAAHLWGCRVVDAEFMYRPRPVHGPTRAVFDGALHSRLSALSAEDGVLWMADSPATLDSLLPLMRAFPHLRQAAALVNPVRWSGDAGDTPHRFCWSDASTWVRLATTDRWARIDFALAVGAALGACWLAMPAHDAVWGRGLLEALMRFALRHARGSMAAAVSPYAPQPHGLMDGAGIPRDVVDVLNAAFERDSLLRWRIWRDQVQGFWGKMALMPCVQCDLVRTHANQTTLEDDLQIDRVLREQGFQARAWWAADTRLYRQVLPVFDRAGVRTVIERTLHYSLNVPGAGVGGSMLNAPRDRWLRWRSHLSPRFARACHEADGLIAECSAEIAERLQTHGASWVDWGAFRHVVRVGDPSVEVWRRDGL